MSTKVLKGKRRVSSRAYSTSVQLVSKAPSCQNIVFEKDNEIYIGKTHDGKMYRVAPFSSREIATLKKGEIIQVHTEGMSRAQVADVSSVIKVYGSHIATPTKKPRCKNAYLCKKKSGID